MILKLLLAVGALAAIGTAEEAVKCSRDFRKVGCFTRNLKLVPHLLITDLDETHKNFTTNIDWGDYGGSLHSLACRCREKALGHYKYFGIGMYGECVAGKANDALDELFKHPEKSEFSCINGEHENCDVDDVNECAGTVDNDFFYEILEGNCAKKIAQGDSMKLFPNQVAIEKNKLVTTLPKLGVVYEISFEVYPTAFQAGWASILHLTVAGNNGVYGDRIPGIWFWPSSSSAKTNKILVCNAFNGNPNFCKSSKQLPLNKWVKVRVNQAKYSKYVYSIYINDEKVYEAENTRPAAFDNVKVYVGDPWYGAQKAQIRNLVIAENCFDVPTVENGGKLSKPNEIVLKKGTLIGKISELCKEYSVSFEVKPTAFAAGWNSVFHLTLGGNYILYGDRSPGIWFRPSSSSAKTNALHICGPINRNRNWCVNTQQFPLNKWISVSVRQEMNGADYYYRIHIDGKQIYEKKNTQPMDLYDLKAYAGDPWYAAQPGSIRNVAVNGECSTKVDVGDVVNVISNQTSITKGKLVKTIDHMGKVYEISFEVYPITFQAGWASVLHLSIAGNAGVYGERTPGVWFYPSSASAKSNKLCVYSPVNGNANFAVCSKQLPLKQWARVKVSQAYLDSKYVYRIFVNGEQIYKMVNSRPASFDDVNVYAGDPWYNPQSGYIRNLVLPDNFFQKETTSGSKLSQPTEVALKKGKLIGTLRKLCKSYTMSLELKATAFAPGWNSVFHVTLGGNYLVYGDRTPGIWYYSAAASAATNKFLICSPISRNRNSCYTSKFFPKNQWISVKIAQVLSRGDYYYSIDINGKRVYMVKNTMPSDFYDLQVYAADPWYQEQAGSIRNVKIDGGSCGKA